MEPKRTASDLFARLISENHHCADENYYLSNESWKKRKGTEMECHFCGRKFNTPFPTQAKYCQINVEASARRARKGMTMGTSPHNRKTFKPRSWPR